ncbi:MAG: SDR family NAD(P)-dependent oxidoreductase, partial [Anaeroplasma sp.]
MNRLKDKVVIITGGNSGVGEATAKLFASEGAIVVISARRKEALDKVAAEIESTGGQVLSVRTDVSNPNDCVELVETTIKHFGHVDVLVNNAGVLDSGLKAIDKFSNDDLNKVIEINQKGTMYCMRAALKYMLEAKSGSIVNVASVAGYTGGGGAAYVSSKAAIIGVTKHAAMRLATSKIRCNVLCPGSIKTPMTANMDYSSMDMEMFGAMAAHSDIKGCQ